MKKILMMLGLVMVCGIQNVPQAQAQARAPERIGNFRPGSCQEFLDTTLMFNSPDGQEAIMGSVGYSFYTEWTREFQDYYTQGHGDTHDIMTEVRAYCLSYPQESYQEALRLVLNWY
jgi:hypothetical protein